MEAQMKRKNAKLLGLLILLLSMVISSCGGTTPTAEVLSPTAVPPTPVAAVPAPTATTSTSSVPNQVQFCTMFASSIVNNGWDRTGYESFQSFAQDPDAEINVLPLKYTEGLFGDQAASAIRAYAESGCDIIWLHGGWSDIVPGIAKEYPNVMFVQVGSGVLSAEGNTYHYMHRCYDGSYLMGVLAGLTTEGTAIGAVGGFPAEDVNDNINGFFEGAKSVDPDLKQKVGFVNSWYDPVAAGEIAEAQKAAGTDRVLMLAENFDVCGPDKNAMCFGPYVDYSQIYPGAVLASFVATWEPGYNWALQEWIKAKTTGVWEGKMYGFETNMVSGACKVVLGEGVEATLSPEVLKQFNDTYEGIMDGTIKPTLNIEEPTSQ
jgi:basic membrane protein A and related proteins